MRVVGQYKGSDIRITGLHMSETYGRFIAGSSEKMYETVNWEMINVGIPQRVEKMWGRDRTLHVMEIDFKKRLSSVEVIVELECAAGTKEGDYSELIMAWFQENDEDPFAKVISNLKSIEWGKKAHAYSASDF
jgi:hypothetical protein